MVNSEKFHKFLLLNNKINRYSLFLLFIMVILAYLMDIKFLWIVAIITLFVNLITLILSLYFNTRLILYFKNKHYKIFGLINFVFMIVLTLCGVALLIYLIKK